LGERLVSHRELIVTFIEAFVKGLPTVCSNEASLDILLDIHDSPTVIGGYEVRMNVKRIPVVVEAVLSFF
jgi:hypothetical protein